MQKWLTRLRILIAGTLLCGPVVAASQTETIVEEVIVYGEKLQRSLLSTHSSVHLLTDESIALSTERDMSEAFDRMPNVTVRGDTEQVTVRGIPRGGFGGSASAVFYMIDGGLYSAALNRTTVPLWDLEQVEVILGAQSTAPISTLGGIVALRTQQPTTDSRGQFMLSNIDKGNQRELGLAVGGGLGRSNVAARLSLHAREDDGFVKNVRIAGRDWNAEDRYMGRLGLRWQPEQLPDSALSLTVQYIEENLDGADFVNLLGGSGMDPFDRKTDYGIRLGVENRTAFAVAQFEHRINEQWSTELLLTLQSLQSDSVWPVSTAPSATSYFLRSGDTDLVTLESRGHYRGERWDVHLSLYARFIDGTVIDDQISFFDFDGPGPLPQAEFARRGNADFDRRMLSALVFANRTFSDDWVVDAGFRIQRSDIDGRRSGFFELASTTGNSAADSILSAIAGSLSSARESSDADYVEFLPVFALTYVVNDGHQLGVKAEKAVRPGDLSLNQFQGVLYEYDQETAVNYEAFYRASVLNQRLFVGVNVFRTMFDDQQVQACFGPQTTNCHVVNAQESSIYGIELNASYAVSQRWRVEASLGALQTEFDRFSVGDVSWSGNEFPNAPEHSAMLAVAYEGPQGLFWSADFTYESESFATANNVAGVVRESRQVINSKVGWRYRGWEIALFGRNLTDDEYHIFINPSPGPFRLADPGDPRQIGVTLRYRWE